uniref:Arginase n=1 Tax=Timema tahoe TaxID=61484 RepID=A0A7R9IHI0_9NEOP|nr:unnamed protein product [Timema tahoe]
MDTPLNIQQSHQVSSGEVLNLIGSYPRGNRAAWWGTLYLVSQIKLLACVVMLKSGVGNAPEAIRSQKLLTDLHRMGYDVKDYGDVTYPAVETTEKFDHNMKALEHIAACHQKFQQLIGYRNSLSRVGGVLNNYTSVHLERKVETTLSAKSGLAGHTLVHNRPRGACPDVLLHVLPSQVSEKVQDVMKDGRVCVTLGGDHSLSIGTVDGHVKARGDVAVLWVDAHADLNTADTSPTGNVHGMPVALLAKELSDYWPYLPGMDWQKPTLSIKQFAYIGLRSVDEYERVIMDKYSITAFGMEDIEYKGIINVVNEALQSIDPLSRLPLHVSFDIDCLDSLEAPSTGTSVRGGMSLREGIQVMEQAHRTGRLSAVDLVEVNPSIGDKRDVHLTLQAAKHLLQAVFGRQRRGNYPNDELVKLVNYNKLDKETNELSET